MYEEVSVVLVRDLFCFVLFNLDFYISLTFSSDSILLLVFGRWYEICCVCFWCLTPIWKIIQLYTGVSFTGGLKRNAHRKPQTVVFNVHCLFPTEWSSWSCSHGSWIYNLFGSIPGHGWYIHYGVQINIYFSRQNNRHVLSMYISLYHVT